MKFQIIEDGKKKIKKIVLTPQNKGEEQALASCTKSRDSQDGIDCECAIDWSPSGNPSYRVPRSMTFTIV